MLMPLVKERIKQALRLMNLYPFLPNTLQSESRIWRDNLPNWADILARNAKLWSSARASASTGPKILIGCGWAGFAGNSLVDSLLAVALTLRGANVHILLCDEALPACILAAIRHYGENERFVKKGPTALTCKECFPSGSEMFRPLGLPTHRLSELISPEEISEARRLSLEVPLAEIPRFRLDGLAIGDHAHSGALRFYMAGSLENEPHGEAVLRHYLHAACRTAFATSRLLTTHSFECVSAVHGIYVPHGVFLEAARKHNVRRVAWSRTYRSRTFIFSHDDTYHRTMLTEPTEDWENVPWAPALEAEIMDYLDSRRNGTRDWITYQKNPQEDATAILSELGVNRAKPLIGMLTNVMGDGQVLQPTNAFRTMLDWAFETIRYFSNRQDFQLIIRVHPAEVRGTDRSRQPVMAEIQKVFPNLPRNIFIIPPESPLSTYAAMLACDSVIIYGTQTGVELTSMGIPVIVAGDAWIKNKGITLDANTVEEYRGLLDRLPLRERLSEEVTQRARKYAYHHFLRRMIYLSFIERAHPIYRLNISGIDELLPGRSVGLDVICNGILKGEKFIYPAELHREVFDDRMIVGSKNGRVA